MPENIHCSQLSEWNRQQLSNGYNIAVNFPGVSTRRDVIDDTATGRRHLIHTERLTRSAEKKKVYDPGHSS